MMKWHELQYVNTLKAYCMNNYDKHAVFYCNDRKNAQIALDYFRDNITKEDNPKIDVILPQKGKIYFKNGSSLWITYAKRHGLRGRQIDKIYLDDTLQTRLERAKDKRK